MQVCGRCGEEKAASEFPARRFSTSDGLHTFCRACKAATGQSGGTPPTEEVKSFFVSQNNCLCSADHAFLLYICSTVNYLLSCCIRCGEEGGVLESMCEHVPSPARVSCKIGEALCLSGSCVWRRLRRQTLMPLQVQQSRGPSLRLLWRHPLPQLPVQPWRHLRVPPSRCRPALLASPCVLMRAYDLSEARAQVVSWSNNLRY